jgi:hypothetical protein
VLGSKAQLADGVQRALGREPKDFADYAREAAATGRVDARQFESGERISVAGGDPLIRGNRSRSASSSCWASDTRPASAATLRRAGPRRRCHVHIAAANAFPRGNQRSNSAISPSRTRRTAALRDVGGMRSRAQCRRGRRRAAGTRTGRGVRGRPRRKSIARTDTPRGLTSQRLHRFTGVKFRRRRVTVHSLWRGRRL